MRSIALFLILIASTVAACGPVETVAGSQGVGGSATAATASGVGGSGGMRADCDDGNPCTSDFFESGECKHAAYTSKIPCSPDGSKTCVGGVCQ